MCFQIVPQRLLHPEARGLSCHCSSSVSHLPWEGGSMWSSPTHLQGRWLLKTSWRRKHIWVILSQYLWQLISQFTSTISRNWTGHSQHSLQWHWKWFICCNELEGDTVFHGVAKVCAKAEESWWVELICLRGASSQVWVRWEWGIGDRRCSWENDD